MAQNTNALQGHTNLLRHPGQVPQHPTADTTGYSQSYSGYSGKATGWIQLCCAVGMIMVGVAQFLLGSPVRFFAIGIWASILCYGPAGILGIVSFRRRTCVISAYIAMSVFSAIIAFVMMLTGAISAPISDSLSCFTLTEEIPCEEGLKDGRTASDAIMGIVGLIEMIVAIVGSAYGCGGVCCNKQSPRHVQELNVVHQYPGVATTHQQNVPYVPRDQPPPYTTIPQQPHQTQPPQQTREPQQPFQHQQTHPYQQTFPHPQTSTQQQTNTSHQPYTELQVYQPLIYPTNQGR